MPTLALTLPTGYSSTAKIRTQPRLGGSWSALIDPVSVVGQVYAYVVPGGDLLVQLTGVSETDGEPFRVREGVAYFYQSWQQIDATIVVPPVFPTAITGLCNVLCAITHNGSPAVNALISATLEDKYNAVNSFIASRSVELGLTNEHGNLVLTLIPFAQFSSGGVYRIIGTAADGRLFMNRRAIVPATPTANLEDLADEPEVPV